MKCAERERESERERWIDMDIWMMYGCIIYNDGKTDRMIDT